MLARKFPLSILNFRKSFPTACLVVRNAFGGVKYMQFSTSKSDSDFEPKRMVPPSYEEVKVKLQELVNNNKVVLFMKGSPSAPQCGFSRQVAQILNDEGLTDYIYVDVLKSEAIRDAVKKFSDWPTIPQLYVKGQFIGGCDICKEMHKAGELAPLLAEN